MTDPTDDELRDKLLEDADRIDMTADERNFPAHFLAHAQRYADNAREAAALLSQHEADKREIGRKDAEIERLREALDLVMAEAFDIARQALAPQERGDA